MITGRPASFSARPATAFIATSAAPLDRADQGQPDAQAGQVHRRQRQAGTDDAEQADAAGGDLQAPAVERAAGQQHRGQGTGADEQQREAELPVADAGLVLDARHRRAPDAPERAEGGECHDGGDQAAEALATNDVLDGRRRAQRNGSLTDREPPAVVNLSV